MTKKIRIMNADASALPVRIRAQHRDLNGEWVDDGAFALNEPGAANENYIHSTRRFIIEEATLSDPKSDTPIHRVSTEMVNRFLAWPLPSDFNPDGGISFSPMLPGSQPTGTNLLTAQQAKAMLQFVLNLPGAQDSAEQEQ